MKLIVTFLVLSIINVIFSTIRSITTIKAARLLQVLSTAATSLSTM